MLFEIRHVQRIEFALKQWGDGGSWEPAYLVNVGKNLDRRVNFGTGCSFPSTTSADCKRELLKSTARTNYVIRMQNCYMLSK